MIWLREAREGGRDGASQERKKTRSLGRIHGQHNVKLNIITSRYVYTALGEITGGGANNPPPYFYVLKVL